MTTKHFLKLNFIFMVLAAMPFASAHAEANCQHPYCETSTAFDQEHGARSRALSSSERLAQELASVGVEQFTASDYKPGVVRHIVLFRYAPSVTSAQKEEVIRRFLALKTLARRAGKNYIISIETGGEISGEGADQGLEQGFIVTFKSEGDRNYYVGQPVVLDSNYYELAHQAFKDFVGPLLDQNGALVFDFAY
jgi:hypothetical protein